MSEELINLLNNKKGLQNIKIEYSQKLKILIVFSNKKLYLIENITEKPKLKVDFDIKFTTIKTILHPNNENQLLILAEESIFIINNLKEFSKQEEIQPLKIPLKNIISIKFSFFENCFGILYKDRTFIYYLYNKNKELEIICEEKYFDIDYIDFNFCPLFSKGFEIFMIFFMTKNGTIHMYGPFFPYEFFLPKEFIFNMENDLLYKIASMEDIHNTPENTIYCLSLKVIDDLKKSIQENDDQNNDYIIISEKMEIFNATFRKREIKILNNFLVNNDLSFLDKNYKQIHILNKRPLTILRISEKNDIDSIMLAEEVMPLELAQNGNFTFNVEKSINNFFIEFIQLNNNEEKDKDKVKIQQYNNEELYIKTNNGLFWVKIPYLNNLKTVSEEKFNDIPNKMNKTTIIKLFKWNNDNNKNKKKSININDILIIPHFQKLFIFAILKEQLSLTLKIKEKTYTEEIKKSDFSNFQNILSENTEYDNQITEIQSKLKENDFIDSSELKSVKIEVEEDVLKDKNIDFESEFNAQMGMIYRAYKDLIQSNEEIYNNKINIMKNIYINLSNSQIKKAIDETIEKIYKLKEKKKDIEKKKEITEKKNETDKGKISEYELNDDEINNYLDTLEKYQNNIGEKLTGIEKNVEFYEKNIEKIFSFTNLFPNFDLNFNLISKDNQVKYLKFEKNVVNNSKKMNDALKEI